MKVDNYVKGAVRQFALWFANGTIGIDLLKDIDYVSELGDLGPSFTEAVFTIFMNNLEYDENGVTNFKKAEYRAAQYVKQYYERKEAEPPFEPWETETYPVSSESWIC